MKNTLYIIISLTLFCFNISANNFDSKNPKNITDDKYNSLKSAIQQVKLMQNEYTGINGTESLFGTSMSIDGNRALIGAPGTNGHGVVYVFEHDGNNWNEVTYLEVPAINVGADFGHSVGLDGDMAIIGAPNDDEFGTDSGSVYVFELSQGIWSMIDQFAGVDTTTNHQFGTSLSIEAGRMVVGAINADRSDSLGAIVSNTGAAYVFEYNQNNWIQTVKLTGFGTNNLSSFARSVSLSDDWILVGARDEVAYVFKYENSSWDNGESLITLSDEAGFGYSVSISGDRALIGAWLDNPTGLNPAQGSAFIYEYNGFFWEKKAKLRAADVDDYYYFGTSVSLSGDQAIVGATGGINPNNSLRGGSAYLFELTQGSWSQTSSFYPPAGDGGDHLGSAVSFWDDGIFVANNVDDNNGQNAGIVYSYQKPATVWIQNDTLQAKSGAVNHNFAKSVAISGNRAIIGIEGDTENGEDSGAAYVYEYAQGNWNFTTKILPNDGTLYLKFGHSVSLDGDRVLISSLHFLENSTFSYGGSVYIFDFANGSWNQTAKLSVLDNDFYGESVSLLGDRAIVGDLGNTINGNYSGLVFVYDLSNGIWTETNQLIPSDGFSGAQFGKSISLSNDRILVGSGRLVNGYGGSAYLFDYSNGSWSETAKLLPADGLPSGADVFGVSVSLSADRALVGANKALNNNTGLDAGAAYVFERSGSNWNQVAKLYSSDGEVGDLFGQSVKLNNDSVVIGVPGDNDNGTDSGSVLTYEKISSNWIQTNKLLANDGEAGDNFGNFVTFNNDYSLIGANKDDSEFGRDSGAAYVFKEDIIFTNSFE